MQVVAVIGAVGRMMIRVGVLILLFVAYQLWGTGLHTDRAQDALAREFEQQLTQLDQSPAVDPSPTGAPSTTSSPTTAAPAAPATAPADLPLPAPGDAIGSISIPDIGADFYIVEGTDLHWLEEGPGHFANTPLPGQPGNAAIAGHRTTYKAPFNRIDELQPGAPIVITTLQGTFTYKVLPQPAGDGEPPVGHYIVGPTQTEILDDVGDNRLTLMACHPKYSAAQRIVVQAKLVTTPAPPTPIPTVTPGEDGEQAPVVLPGDELAGGNDSARLWTVVFSAAAIVVWFGAWFIAYRYHRLKWVAYAVALPFFAVLLFFAFDNINQLLPGAY